MSSSDKLKHPGIVVEKAKASAKVLILSQSACSSCHAKGACGLMDMQEKIIDVDLDENIEISLNEKVNVVMKQSYGMKAVLYGYFLPILLVIALLVGLSVLTENETLMGVAAISILIPYYAVLYTMKEKLKSKFRFHLEKDYSELSEAT